jgi:hypothetical protein
MDFIIFPIMFTLVQFWEVDVVNNIFRQWSPITLSNGGLFHMAMGAIVGVTAWSRGREKIIENTNSTSITIKEEEEETI